MASKELSPAEAKMLESTEQTLALISTLEKCPGYQQLVLPRVHNRRAELVAQIMSGKCPNFEAYRAACATVQMLDDDILATTTTDKRRHMTVYADLTGTPHPAH